MLFSSCVCVCVCTHVSPHPAPPPPPPPPQDTTALDEGPPTPARFPLNNSSSWPHSPVRWRWEILGLHQHVAQSLTAFPLYLWCLPRTTSLYKLGRLWFSPRISQFYAWIVACPRANRHVNGKLTLLFFSLSHICRQLLSFQSVLNGIMAATCRKSGPNQLFRLTGTLLFSRLACIVSPWAFWCFLSCRRRIRAINVYRFLPASFCGKEILFYISLTILGVCSFPFLWKCSLPSQVHWLGRIKCRPVAALLAQVHPLLLLWKNSGIFNTFSF